MYSVIASLTDLRLLLVFFVVMAVFKCLSEVKGDCLLSSFSHVLENAGLDISFSSPAQIFAEFKNVNGNYKLKVKVLISWSDKNKEECYFQVRSDEPYLRRDTRCQKIHSHFQKVIPLKELSANLLTAEV